MALRAIRRDARVVHHVDAVVRRIRVTERAGLGRRNVIRRHARAGLETRGVVVALAAAACRRMRCRRARDHRHAKVAHAGFVTGLTGERRDPRVIHRRAGKGHVVRRRVAGFASRIGNRDVRRRHALGTHVVVAARAIARHADVAETAPLQPIVVWQASHSRSVFQVRGTLALGCTPLWHVEQLPRASV